ncbi:MAG: signal peptide peptidase SppA [Bdellovibrio sp.]
MNRPQNSNKAVYGVFFIVFFFFVILMMFAIYTVKVLDREENLGIREREGNSIAVVEIDGVIMDSQRPIELLQMAERDTDSKAILLRVNSPGGAVGPTQEIYEEIRRIDQKYDETNGKEGKPIYASFGSVAASGGYYVAAATRRIYSSPGTVTGSIGVIMQFLDASELVEFAKVRMNNVKAGRYKDIGQPTRKMTDEERGLLDQTMSVVHRQFINDILRTRKDRLKGDINELAQGQIFSGEEAQKVGLVDELAGMWEAGRRIHDELKIEQKFGLKFIKKKKKVGIMDILNNVDESISNIDWRSFFEKTPMLMFKM